MPPHALHLHFKPQIRTLTTTAKRRASVLFALSALSNSRETQHFNRITRLPRTEHSPPLKLIQTSEVDPFPLPTPPPRLVVASAGYRSARSAAHVWDDKALKVGRVLLADQARQSLRYRRVAQRAAGRESKVLAALAREQKAWREENRKLRNDLRSAGIYILLAVGTATALATWRLWPERVAMGGTEDLGRKLAARASKAMPLPAAVGREAVGASTPIVAAEATPVVASSPVPVVRPVDAPTVDIPRQTAWWRNLFWKQ